MTGQNGEAGFVNIAQRDGSDDFMELPQEKDGTVLLSTVQAQFPSAIGLKYKSSSGGWRGIRAADNVLDPPFGGWGETIYCITESDALKRKSSGRESNGHAEKSRKSSSLLQDIIVLGLPYTTTDEEFSKYFTDSCGELAFHEIKFDRDTKKSRGFGFIRFKNEDAAKEALSGHHSIQGRNLEVRVSKKKDDNPTKLFVGRLPGGTTKEDVNEYFSEFGDLVDVFVPSPFRGFGFITYGAQEDAMKVLRMGHVLGGANLNVTAAAPKEDKTPVRQDNSGVYNYNTNSNDPGNNWNSPQAQNNRYDPKSFQEAPGNNWNSPQAQNNRYDPKSFQETPSNNWSSPQAQNNRYDPKSFQETPVQKDVTSELKEMLLTLIKNQK